MRRAWRRHHGTGGEGGEAAVELVAGLALLLGPVVALAVTLPGWAEARYAVEAAAVEAGRAAGEHGDVDAAAALATQIVANHGLADPPEVDVMVPVDRHGRPARHGEATVTVTATVPAVDLPGVGAVGGWSLSRTHREPLDPWRALDDG